MKLFGQLGRNITKSAGRQIFRCEFLKHIFFIHMLPATFKFNLTYRIRVRYIRFYEFRSYFVEELLLINAKTNLPYLKSTTLSGEVKAFGNDTARPGFLAFDSLLKEKQTAARCRQIGTRRRFGVSVDRKRPNWGTNLIWPWRDARR